MSEEQNKTEIDPSDLQLVDQLADAGKDDAEIWSEMQASEAGAKGDDGTDTTDGADNGDTGAQQAADGQDEPAATDGAEDSQKASEPDPWASADPKLKAERDALLAEKRRLEQDASSQRGRASAFQRKYEELRKAPQKQGARPSARDAVAALKEEYPELAEPLAKAFGVIEDRLKEVDNAEASRRQAATTEVVEHIQAETAEVEREHPGYYDFLKQNGAAFAAWVEDQPRSVREAAYRNAEDIVDARAAIDVLSRFKQHLGQPASAPAAAAQNGAAAPAAQPLNDRRKRQLESSASPQTSRRPTVSGIPEDGDPQEIWEAMRRREQAQAARA